MKKALFATLIGLAVIVSCTKETQQVRHIALKTLSYTMDGGSMYTKSAEDVLSIIQSSLPEHISLILRGQNNGKVIVAQTGDSQNIPSDTYNVTGTYIGNQIGKDVSGAGDAIQNEPAITISNTPLTITDEETQYTISASYNCFAIACDLSIVDKVTFTDAFGTETTIPFRTLNDTGVIFAYGDFTQNYLHLTVKAKDTDLYRDGEYTITTGASSTLSRAQKGKWYMVSPAMQGAQPKWLELDLPQMTQGEF